MGLLEAISFMETNDALASVGYAIQDISEDGIPELLIVAIAEKTTPLLTVMLFWQYIPV